MLIPRPVLGTVTGSERVSPGHRRFPGSDAFHRVSALLLCLATVPRLLSAPLQFEITVSRSLPTLPQVGRVFVLLSRTNSPEPRLALEADNTNAPLAFARDVLRFGPGSSVVIDQTAFGFPLTNVLQVSSADYFVQAVFDSNQDMRSVNAPGNLYSTQQKIHLDPEHAGRIKLELIRQIPPEQLPAETELIKFIKIKSKLLSEFHRRPIYLRAGIVLPKNYERDSSRRYPLWVRIGGFNTRYTVVNRFLAPTGGFRSTWLGEQTPRFVLLQLDGAGPFGDPYYVNSANNGPYGDALVQELIPAVESRFRVRAESSARVLSGTSTGGWVALALQIFYPDHFNGAWASSPDPVDFRAFELLNLYEDENAYRDSQGWERPSVRDLKGATTLTMRQEVGFENLLGHGNSFTTSGEQWGAWTAVFSSRGPDGLPIPLWDPQSGVMSHQLAPEWRKYDLRLFLEEHWNTLGPKLRGKLHIAVGEADQYFLNKAVHLLDEFLSHAQPPAEAKIFYGPGKGHGWSNLTSKQMLQEMELATGPAR